MDKPKNMKELKDRLRPFVNMDNEVMISKEAKVLHVGKMIRSHVSILEANPKNRVYMPYWDRLIILLSILESGWE